MKKNWLLVGLGSVASMMGRESLECESWVRVPLVKDNYDQQ